MFLIQKKIRYFTDHCTVKTQQYSTDRQTVRTYVSFLFLIYYINYLIFTSSNSFQHYSCICRPSFIATYTCILANLDAKLLGLKLILQINQLYITLVYITIWMTIKYKNSLMNHVKEFQRDFNSWMIMKTLKLFSASQTLFTRLHLLNWWEAMRKVLNLICCNQLRISRI